MKYHVYVLRSQRNKKKYVGFTRKSIDDRVDEHNSGSNNWTRNNGPFVFLYAETFKSRKKALIREKYFKSAAGRRFLKLSGF